MNEIVLESLPLVNHFPHMSIALTIAGSDPSGGAGLQADLKTFQQLGVYGASAITLVTVQNTQGVERIEWLSPDLITQQIRSVLTDIPPDAIKIGALGKHEAIEAVAAELVDCSMPIVLDPVLVSKHGHSLADNEAVAALRDHLLPRVDWVTPNRFEAERLTGRPIRNLREAEDASSELHESGAKNVLLKFGECEGKSLHVLITNEGCRHLVTDRIPAKDIHGSGCVLAALLTAGLARGENDPVQLAKFAIQRITQSVRYQSPLGKGTHPAETRAISN